MDNNKAKEIDKILDELKQPSAEHTTEQTGTEEVKEEVKVTAFVAEVAEEDDNIPKRKKPARKKAKKHSRKQIATAVFGFIITIFAIVGIVATVFSAVNLTNDLINNKAQKQELAEFIFPLVIIDVPAFESPSDLDNNAVISAAVWALVTDDSADLSKYPTDDFGTMEVPEVDIEKYVRQLFGNDVEIQHGTVYSSALEILYATDTKTYQVESAPRYIPYVPQVTEISSEGDVYTLTVTYSMPGIKWAVQEEYTSQLVKTMEYTLNRAADGSYTIAAVELISLNSQNNESGETTEDPFARDENTTTFEDDIISSGNETASSSEASSAEESSSEQDSED